MGPDESMHSQDADEAVYEERAREYHLSRIKLKVFASIKLFNQ